MGVTRYNIIRLQVDRPGQIIRFQHKVPSYLKRCTGFKAVHVRGIGTDLLIPEIGWLTASFNSLKEEAIVAAVAAQPFYEPEETHEYQSLDVNLLPGQLVVGVYLDTCPSNIFAPYIVSLYLRCTDSVEKPQVKAIILFLNLCKRKNLLQRMKQKTAHVQIPWMTKMNMKNN